MKNRILLSTVFLFAVFKLLSNPVAVNDTVDAYLGDTVTVHVLENDYSPEGLPMHIYYAPDADFFTDSTITYIIDFERFHNFRSLLDIKYAIKDSDGNTGYESIASVIIIIHNEKYSSLLDINNVNAAINSGNSFFQQGFDSVGQNIPSRTYEFPKGGGVNSIASNSLWIGGKDNTGKLHFAGSRYNQLGLDFWPGPVCSNENGLWADSLNIKDWNKIRVLTKEEVIYHKLHWSDPDYEPIEDIAQWPGNGNTALGQARFLAPFVDVDGDSVYNPYNGDYPLIRGDKCGFFILNDLRQHTESEGTPLGIEVHVMAYAFHNPDKPSFENTIFMNYKIFNRSQNSYDSTYLALFTDFDIGYAWDDYVGCDVSRSTYFGYNGRETDKEYGDNPPVQGVIILGGPYLDADNSDNPDGGCDESITGIGFGDGIVDNERLGMTGFIDSYNSSNLPNSDPRLDFEYYNRMKSVWLDGTVLEYGGAGHVNTGSYGPACRFIFPGISDPCNWGTGGIEPYGPVDWTAETAAIDSGDYRGIGISGPFTFKPGNVESVDVAFTGAFASDGLSAFDNFLTYVDTIRAQYKKNSDFFGYQWLGTKDKIKSKTEQLKVFPNPVSNTLKVLYNSNGKKVNIQIINNIGKIVAQKQTVINRELTLDMTLYPAGIYFIRIIASNSVSSAKIIKH